jgi:hypothetical protein
VGAEVVKIILVWLPGKPWHVGALGFAQLQGTLHKLAKLTGRGGQSTLPLLKLLEAVTIGGWWLKGLEKFDTLS